MRHVLVYFLETITLLACLSSSHDAPCGTRMGDTTIPFLDNVSFATHCVPQLVEALRTVDGFVIDL
jgi:hypothetical protein